jgi:hypothetical protein
LSSPACRAGPAGHPAHDAPGAMAVEPLPARADQDGARNSFAYGQVERPGRARGEGMVTTLPLLVVWREALQ